jgi:hypothetical protein
MNTSSKTIAITIVRPSNTTNGVWKIGFKAPATSSASASAIVTRRSVSAAKRPLGRVGSTTAMFIAGTITAALRPGQCSGPSARRTTVLRQ